MNYSYFNEIISEMTSKDEEVKKLVSNSYLIEKRNYLQAYQGRLEQLGNN